MNIKKLLASIGILGGICGLITGVSDYKKAGKEEYEDPYDVVIEPEKDEKEETTEEE